MSDKLIENLNKTLKELMPNFLNHEPVNFINDPYYDQYNWDMPSKAVVACLNGDGVILFFAGPHIKYEVQEMGLRRLDDLGLDDCPDGIWVWEGIYQNTEVGSYDCKDIETHPDGQFRKPNTHEWTMIELNENPWHMDQWLKKHTTICKVCNYKYDELLEMNMCQGCYDEHNMTIKPLKIPIVKNDCGVSKSVDIVCAQPMTKNEVETKCDCGGEKAKTTHSDWCSKRKLLIHLGAAENV